MRIIEAESGPKIYVGHMLENEVTKVQFDPYPFYDAAGTGGTFSVYILRYGETEGYVVSSPLVAVEDGYVYWTVTTADVAIAGDNECQLRYTVSGKVAMSKKYKYVVAESISVGDTVPAPMQEWADEITEVVSQVVPMPEDMVQVPLVNSMGRVLGIEDGEVVQVKSADVLPGMHVVRGGSQGYIAANGTLDFDMVGDGSGGVKAVMFMMGASDNVMQVVLLNTTSSAALSALRLTDGTNPVAITTLSTESHTTHCRITNGGTACYVYFLVFRGSVTIV